MTDTDCTLHGNPVTECGECLEVVRKAHIALYGDERPRSRVRITVGEVGVGVDTQIEVSVPYTRDTEGYATIFETVARMLRAPSVSITDGEPL